MEHSRVFRNLEAPLKSELPIAKSSNRVEHVVFIYLHKN